MTAWKVGDVGDEKETYGTMGEKGYPLLVADLNRGEGFTLYFDTREDAEKTREALGKHKHIQPVTSGY